MRVESETPSSGQRHQAYRDGPYQRIGLLTLVLTFGVLMLWASWAPLQSAVVAGGRLSVASKNKVVQHLDGGLVREIHVRDGDVVEAGQVLLSLDRQSLLIREQRIKRQILENRAALQRLAAERDEREELKFQGDLGGETHPDWVKEILLTQALLFGSRQDALHSELDVLRQRITQAEGQIQGGGRLIATYQDRIALLDQDIKGIESLKGRKLATATQLRELQRQRSELQGEKVSQEVEIARLSEAKAEARHRMALSIREYRKEVVARMQERQSREIDLQAERDQLRDQLSRTRLLAPVSGKIKGFELVTLGGVINAGKPIMEIVPRDQDFRIQARISPMDIDSLYPGMRAEVRFPVFEGAQNFPSLFANLTDVSTDIFQPPNEGEAHYRASLDMDAHSLEILSAEQLKLVSGMPVEVVIKTGQRHLSDYLIQPLKNMMVRAFNER